jgi:hypothetical protein
VIKGLKRKLAIVRKRSGRVRHVIPAKMVRTLKKLENDVLEYSKRKYYNVSYKSKYTNIYHFALQKTGTQWLFDILSDPLIYMYSGMTLADFRGVRRKSQTHKLKGLDSSYSKNTIVSSIAGTYANYVKDIPKNDGKNALFFVIRDPREMVVSWYFSTKNNHIVDRHSMLNVIRQKLIEKSKKDGLMYVIELFEWKGKFDVMRSWINNRNKENIRIVKFEDLTQKSFKTFGDLFRFLDIGIPPSKLKELLSSYSFETLTGRKKGNEEKSSHMRAGHSNSWRKHFDSELTRFFNRKAGDIVEGFSY